MARGETTRAVEIGEQTVEFTRGARDPQLLYPALANAARLRADAGQLDAAGERTDELLALAQRQGFHANVWVLELAFALVRLGRADEATALFERMRMSSLWLDAAKAFASGDAAAAAEVLAGMGAVAVEAYTRLAGAEAGMERAGLERAVAFYRGVGATGYLRRAEELFPATA